MKAPAEKSPQRRRPSSVAGRRVPSALARFFRRAALTGALAALVALCAPALVASPAHADEPAAAAPAKSTLPPEELERQAEAIARSIMSPFCPGRTVSACPVAGPWRDDIRHWVAEGVDAIEIKRRLAERVPEHNLGGVPKNRLGWVLPVGLGVAAVGLLVFLLRRLVGPRAKAAGGTATGEAKAGALEAGELEGSGKPATLSEAAGASKANSAASKANGEDYDARLKEELETFEQ